MRRRRVGRRHLGRVLIACASAIFALVLGAPVVASAAPLVASRAVEVPPPGNATQGRPDTQVEGVSCPSVSGCWAVGLYEDEQGEIERMLATESKGAWTAEALAIAPPPGDFLSLDGISCLSGGECSETGRAAESAGSGSIPLVISEADGRGSEATVQQIEPPEDNSEGHPQGGFEAISCPAAGECVAVGSYLDAEAHEVPMVALEHGGKWPTAAETPASLAALDGDLRAVACTAVEACTAVGDSIASPYQQALAVELQAGGWQSPQGLPGTGVNGNAILEGVSCASVGECNAVGDEETLPPVVLRAHSVAGEWRTEAGPSEDTFFFETLDAVSCPLAGGCVAVGDSVEGGTVEAQYGGAWQRPESIPPPPPGASGEALISVSCASAEVCTAVGTDKPSDGGIDAMAVTLVPAAPALSIVTTALPSATVGSSYQAQLSASGGTDHYAWSVTGGSLPAGLSLDAATGTISGVPTSPRTETFTVTLVDSGPPEQQQTRQFTIAVAPAASPAKIETPLPQSSPRGASIAIISSQLAKHRSVAKVKLACTGERCAGKLTLSTVLEVRVRRHHKTLLKKESLRLAQTSYSLAAGSSRTLTLRLSKRGKRLLTVRRRLPLLVRVQASLAGGNAAVESTLWG